MLYLLVPPLHLLLLITAQLSNLLNQRSRKKTLMKPKIVQRIRIALSRKRKKILQRNLQSLKTSLDQFLVRQCLELHGISSNACFFILLLKLYSYIIKPANIFVCEGASFGRETDGYFSTILLRGYQFGRGRMILLGVRT
jgi:hypothetical protein